MGMRPTGRGVRPTSLSRMLRACSPTLWAYSMIWTGRFVKKAASVPVATCRTNDAGADWNSANADEGSADSRAATTEVNSG